MKKFKVYLDVKGTVWTREFYDIEATSFDEAKKIAEDLYKSNTLSNLDIQHGETLYETFEPMSPSENGEQPTEELFVDDYLVITNLSSEDTSDFDDPGFDHRIEEEQNFIEEEREDRTSNS